MVPRPARPHPGTMSDTATPTRPRLVRRPDDRVVAGVASGVAQHFGIDVTIVRVGFVVATVLGGFGILAYLGAWLFLPTPGDDRPGPRDWRFWLGLAFLVSAFFTVVARFDLPDSGWVFAILLIGVGVALWRQPVMPQARRWPLGPRRRGGPDGRSGDGGPGGGPGGGPSDGPGGPGGPDGGGGPAGQGVDVEDRPAGTALVPVRFSPPAAPGSPAAPFPHGRGLPPGSGFPPATAAPPRPPSRAEVRAVRPRSWLASATLAAALIATGVAVGLDRADAVDVSSAQAAAVALTVLGLGLVVGAFAGRARSLIVPAIVLVPFVATLGTLDHLGLDPFDSTGDRTYHVDGVADPDLRPAYHLGTGELRLDLSRFDPAGSTVAVRADVAVGALRVWVPEDVEVAVRGQVAAGDLSVVGAEHDGRGVDERFVVPGVAGRGRIDLDLEVGFGVVRVVRGSPDGFLGPADVPPNPAEGPTEPGARGAAEARARRDADGADHTHRPRGPGRHVRHHGHDGETVATSVTTAATAPGPTLEGAR